MYNLRYHLASLVAVFLSLAIGLLLGTIVVERGTLDTQRDSIVTALQDEFRSLSEENSELSEENAALDSFVNDTLPALVGGRLEGRTIVVLVNSGRVDGLGSVADAIRMAGARPVTVTLNEASLGLDQPEVSEAATSVIGPVADDQLLSGVIDRLAAEWTDPAQGRLLTEALVASNALAIGDFPAEAAVDGAVNLAAWDQTPDEAAFGIANAIAQRGGAVSAAEAASHSTDLAAAAAERGVSAVDDVGSPQGQYALVMVLAGEAEGYFGLGPGAQARYPMPTLQRAEETPE